MRRQLEVAAVIDRKGASDALHLPECGKTMQLEVEQVVAGDHEQVVVAPGSLQHERDVPDRAEAVLVRESAVVVDGDTAAAGRPAAEVVREAAVGDEVDVVTDLLDLVADPVEHRPATDREQLLCNRVRQGRKPGRIPRGQDDRPHTRSGAGRAGTSAL